MDFWECLGRMKHHLEHDTRVRNERGRERERRARTIELLVLGNLPLNEILDFLLGNLPALFQDDESPRYFTGSGVRNTDYRGFLYVGMRSQKRLQFGRWDLTGERDGTILIFVKKLLDSRDYLEIYLKTFDLDQLL